MEDIFENSSQEIESLDIKRYVRAVLKKWWLIGLITCGLLAPWFLYLKNQPPVYESRVTVSFESVAGRTPADLISTRRMLLTSRSFAEEATAELGLTMEIIEREPYSALSRQDVFTYFSTTRDPDTGDYSLRFYPNGYVSLYFNKTRLDSLHISECMDTPVSYQGISFSIEPQVAKVRNRVDFRVNNFQGAVNSLRANQQVRFSATGDEMHLYLRDKDPVLASMTANKLANLLIQKSHAVSHEKHTQRRDYLADQLNNIQSQLIRIDRQRQAFGEEYVLGLDEEKRSAINRLRDLNADSTRLNISLNDIENLLSKFDPNQPDFSIENLGHYIYRQIANLPAFDNHQSMGIARRQLNDFDERKRELNRRNVPEQNPDMIELSERISRVENRVIDLAREHVMEIRRELHDIRTEMNEKQVRLSNLPAEETQLISLIRQQQAREDIHAIYLRQFQEAEISAAVASENIQIIDKAIPSFSPVSSDKRKKAALGGIIALLLGFGTVIVTEMVDKRVKTREDINRYLSLPLLGVIPKVKFDKYELLDSEKAKSISSQIVTHDYSPTPVGEAYRALRTSLLFNKSIGEIKSIAIGSVAPGEGKSFTAANLAITLAQQKTKTLLIDADLRRGVLHNSFSCPKKPGLTNYLTGVVPLETVLNETYIPNLSLITCGSLLPNPSELLGSDRMKRFIEGITQRFDFVIFDTPPLMAATDAIILSTLVDGIAVLIRSGMTNREDVKRKLELFYNIKSKVLGAILNCAGVEVAHEGYSYYSY